MPRSRKKLKVVIFTGYACNNNCVFCVSSGKRGLPPRSTAELSREIYLAAEKGADELEFVGGESAMRADFPALVALAKRLGVPEVLCATNGRAFSDMAFARRAVASGLDSLVFSVHGASAAEHDALTRAPGSFRQLLAGLRNLRELGFRGICGNTAVVRRNAVSLRRIAALYARHGVRHVEFIFVDPSGGALERFRSVVPRISVAAERIRAALDSGAAAGFGRWKARYVPLCYFADRLGQVSELNEGELFFSVEHRAQDFTDGDVAAGRARNGRGKTARCRGCRLYGACEGIWLEYLRRYGDSELRPVK